MTKIIANLNGKALVRDKEIDLHTRVVIEHAFVVCIIAILPQKGNSHKVFQQGGICINKEEIEDTIVGEVLIADRLFLHKWRSDIVHTQQQPCILTIQHIVAHRWHADLTANRGQYS